MATELTVQNERAFQKQPHIFLNSKVKAKSGAKNRWYKEVGLGFKTPATAISGSYIGTFTIAIEECRRKLNRFGLGSPVITGLK